MESDPFEILCGILRSHFSKAANAKGGRQINFISECWLAMRKNRLGRSSIVVSDICMGTMTFGSQADEKMAFEILDRAFAAGIDFYDTATVGNAFRTEITVVNDVSAVDRNSNNSLTPAGTFPMTSY